MWFEVDKEGLSKLLERRGKAWVISELIQNAWDETKTKNVEAVLEMLPGRPRCRLSVTDDNPDGFRDLTQSYTLFAESYKKVSADKRGRFNLGEKLVLALCHSAIISSTTGTIEFNELGRHSYPRRKRSSGTVFEAQIKMTREEYEQVCKEVRRIIPPAGIRTVFNGEVLPSRTPVAQSTVSLMTELADEQGFLRRVRRDTRIDIYPVQEGETAYVYEMGIPVVETGDRFHVDIQQKVPLNMERDSLPESYLQQVRAYVLNATDHLLTTEDSSSSWVSDALESDKIAPAAIGRLMDLRFGTKRVISDPSDPEANNLAVTKGYTVIPGRSLSKEQWANVKSVGAALPAGQVTPSPKPFSKDGKPLKVLSESEFKAEHWGMTAFAKWMARNTIGVDVGVVFANDRGWHFGGAFGPDSPLYINALQDRFSGNVDPLEFIDFLIHEYGHFFELNHLSSKYYDALTRIGAQVALALRLEPDAIDLLKGVRQR